MTTDARPRPAAADAGRPPLSAADELRLAGLRRMKRIAGALLGLAAVVFAVSFALQDAYPWLQYVRAAAEGAMVGAIADWFAVTALFRYPLGLRIPHTAIIPNRKDEIGASLGEFVETNFLSEEVIRGKLASFDVANRLGAWLALSQNAERLTAEAAAAARGVMTLLSDDDVKDLIEKLARRHLVEPEWGPSIGRVGSRLVAADQQRAAIDLVLDSLEAWLVAHPEAFGSVVSGRLPRWVPGFVGGFVDDRTHREALGLVHAIRDDPDHPLRASVDRYLTGLTDDLQHDDGTIARVEAVKADLIDSPRLRELADELWASVKVSLDESLADPDSALRVGIRSAVAEVGTRVLTDPILSAKINAWLADAAAHIVSTYRHDIAAVITETVERWDARETTEKIELQVGRDLQYIRINGTVVGAIAGAAIYAVAAGIHALF